ncbi:MAG: hypothetical protein IKW82_09685 [Bacteroidales bacterium]|nr:hypothetical protein [Bacteroidales bacterium]
MARRLALFFILLFTSLLGFSQNLEQDSIATKKTTVTPSLPIDSTFVTYNAYPFDSIFLNASKVVDTTTFHTADFDYLQRGNTIYSTLSNTGMAHKSMRFNHLHQAGFDMTLPAFPTYLLNEGNMASYMSVLPYSEIRYLMTIGDLEQHFHARFGRQVTPRLLVSFAFDTDYSPATFNNNKTINNAFWINAKYITKSERYGVSAHWYRNKLEMGENGGIVNDEAYSEHQETDNTVIPVNLTTATNFIVSSGIGFEQYFNLLPKKTITTKKEAPHVESDSIAPSPVFNDSIPIDSLFIDSIKTIENQDVVQEVKVRKFTLGRLCHNFSFLNNKLYYNESSPGVSFYQPFDTLMNTSKSTDTTLVRAIKNTVKWSSLGYQKYNDDIPFYLYAGVTHGFYQVKRYDYLEGETILARNYNQLSVNGGIIVNLFKSTRITGQAELITLGYQIGDFDVKGQWKQFIGTSSKNYGQATFDVELKRQSANWFEESYYSNHFRWENDFNASTYLTFNLRYSYKTYSIGVKQTSIANMIYFGTDARPTQNDGMFSIREAYLSFYQRLGRFELEGFASLQKSSNEEVMHLPLVLGQLKVGYSQPIFHKAATLHPSITVRYFTKYYADAYMPATRTFYLQNDVEIGNFPFIDLALAIKVKKAHIYAAYSNMFLLTGDHNSFIAPHYPMRDSKIFIGVNWRLFN